MRIHLRSARLVPDPATHHTGDPQTLNLYAYCANDPVNSVDPDGLGFLSFFKKLFKGIWKVLKSKWFALAVGVALAVISFGASAGWWALSKAVSVPLGMNLGLGPVMITATQTTALGWVAGALGAALAVPGLTSVSGLLRRAAGFGVGQAIGVGGPATVGGTPDWNPDANQFSKGPRGGTQQRSRPRFPQSQYHSRKHPIGRRPMTRREYYESAVRHTRKSHKQYLVTHVNPDGSVHRRIYHLSRLGNDQFLLTATTPNGKVIVTHYVLPGKDVRKLGINVNSYPPGLNGPFGIP